VAKILHEIRDPIHTFIRVDDHDRRVLDSEPVQRLRQIHQLAMSYLVYPGGTHRRFEHSLGVMDLAGTVFDVVTRPENVVPEVEDMLPKDQDERAYWRRALRMAALCHDVGHLPFSHAQEGLLPAGWNHERMTVALVTDSPLSEILLDETPPLIAKHVARLAVDGKTYAKHFEHDRPPKVWESLLGDVILGDAFGVDRMDYLLRDSLHAGVAYGRFDYHRLIDSLRVLRLPVEEEAEGPREPQLGVTEGGLQSAEALLLARYFMWTQVYLHPVRRIYDFHLGEFLHAWLPGGLFSTVIADHLAMTDVEVLAALRLAAQDQHWPGHEPARRIIEREHFKVLWRQSKKDTLQNVRIGDAIESAAWDEFGPEMIKRPKPYTQRSAVIDFPVKLSDGRVTSALAESDVLQELPPIASDVVYVEPTLRDKAKRWLEGRLPNLLRQVPREEG
jgi:hypothetical protein